MYECQDEWNKMYQFQKIHICKPSNKRLQNVIPQSFEFSLFQIIFFTKICELQQKTQNILLFGYYFISDKKLKLSIISWLLKFILRKDALIRLWFELWDLIGRVTIMLTILSTYENTWCCSRVFFIAGSTGTLISSRAFNIWDKNADKLELRKKAWSS